MRAIYPMPALLVLLALMLSISPVSADVQIQTFEDNNLSAWGGSGSSSPSSHGHYLGSGYNSSKALYLYAVPTYPFPAYQSAYRTVYRSVDLTNIDEFSYYWRIPETNDHSYSTSFKVMLGSTTIHSGSTYYATNWAKRTYDVSHLTGVHTLTIQVLASRDYDDGARATFAIDDVTVGFVQPPEPEPEYTLYINGVSNNRNYYVNASNHPYTLFFYFQERLDFAVSDYEPGVKYFINCTSSNSSYPYSFEWMADPDSFVNWPAHLDTRANHYPSGGNYVRIQYQDVPVAYTFNMYRVEVTEGAIPDAYFDLWPSFIGNWLRSRIGTSDVTLTKVDDITVVLNKVSEIPPDAPQNETSQPEFPDLPVPDIPEYVPNYTAPEPQPGNDTKVGSSFLSGYYAGVDSIIQPVNDSVSGVLSFAVSPIVTLGGSVLTMNAYLSSSLETALYYIDPLALIIDAVFNAIPAKVQFLFQLSLILVGVLVVLRWR